MCELLLLLLDRDRLVEQVHVPALQAEQLADAQTDESRDQHEHAIPVTDALGHVPHLLSGRDWAFGGPLDARAADNARVAQDQLVRHSLPAVYIDAGGLDYGYAMTIHKAQGLTCDRAYVLGDEHLYRAAAYTGLSRGRHENRLHAVGPERDYETHRIDPDIIHDAISRALERSEYKSLAAEWQPPGRTAERTQDAGMEL